MFFGKGPQENAHSTFCSWHKGSGMEVKFIRTLAKKSLSTRNVPSTGDGIPKTMK